MHDPDAADECHWINDTMQPGACNPVPCLQKRTSHGFQTCAHVHAGSRGSLFLLNKVHRSCNNALVCAHAGSEISPEGSSGSLTLQPRSPSGTRMTPLLKSAHKPSQMTAKWHSLPVERRRPASPLATPQPHPSSPTPQRPTRYSPAAANEQPAPTSHASEVKPPSPPSTKVGLDILNSMMGANLDFCLGKLACAGLLCMKGVTRLHELNAASGNRALSGDEPSCQVQLHGSTSQ